MSDAYAQLLEATLQHLEGLRERGVRFVPVSRHALSELRQPVRTAAAARPALAPPSAAPRGATTSVPTAGVVQEPVPSAKPVFERTLAQSLPAQAPASSLAPAAQSRAAAFAELRQRAMACRQCAPLAAARRNVVFGVGSLDAELMFVGEAPGADEDAQGEPFVGRAGELLTRIIKAMGLTRESVYIANILKCRPDTPGQTAGNRKPTSEEMQTCIPFLHEQIDLIRPKVIVALGATAVEGLLGKTIGITRLRGHWQIYRATPLMPTYHPAYLLRNQSPLEKRRVWEDMLQVMEKLALPISEKQRNYFTKG